MRPGLDGPGRRPPHEAGSDPAPGFRGRGRCFSREAEGRVTGPERGARVCPAAPQAEAVGWAGPPAALPGLGNKAAVVSV